HARWAARRPGLTPPGRPLPAPGPPIMRCVVTERRWAVRRAGEMAGRDEHRKPSLTALSSRCAARRPRCSACALNVQTFGSQRRRITMVVESRVDRLSASELAERTVHRRAVEAVVWGMPAVNTDLMYQAMVREVKGDWNQIVYWSRLLDWKNQTLTPNPDAIYLMPFFNTAQAGPLVLEIPPADEGWITGSIMDCWQTPREDVGPAGVDQGRGGKYLILPPDHSGAV